MPKRCAFPSEFLLLLVVVLTLSVMAAAPSPSSSSSQISSMSSTTSRTPVMVNCSGSVAVTTNNTIITVANNTLYLAIDCAQSVLFVSSALDDCLANVAIVALGGTASPIIDLRDSTQLMDLYIRMENISVSNPLVLAQSIDDADPFAVVHVASRSVLRNIAVTLTNVSFIGNVLATHVVSFSVFSGNPFNLSLTVIDCVLSNATLTGTVFSFEGGHSYTSEYVRYNTTRTIISGCVFYLHCIYSHDMPQGLWNVGWFVKEFHNSRVVLEHTRVTMGQWGSAVSSVLAPSSLEVLGNFSATLQSVTASSFIEYFYEDGPLVTLVEINGKWNGTVRGLSVEVLNCVSDLVGGNPSGVRFTFFTELHDVHVGTSDSWWKLSSTELINVTRGAQLSSSVFHVEGMNTCRNLNFTAVNQTSILILTNTSRLQDISSVSGAFLSINGNVNVFDMSVGLRWVRLTAHVATATTGLWGGAVGLMSSSVALTSAYRCAFHTYNISVVDCALTSNVYLVQPPMPLMLPMPFGQYVSSGVAVIGFSQANCSDCALRVDNTILIPNQTQVVLVSPQALFETDQESCSGILVVLNVTGFLAFADPSLSLSACAAVVAKRLPASVQDQVLQVLGGADQALRPSTFERISIEVSMCSIFVPNPSSRRSAIGPHLAPVTIALINFPQKFRDSTATITDTLVAPSDSSSSNNIISPAFVTGAAALLMSSFIQRSTMTMENVRGLPRLVLAQIFHATIERSRFAVITSRLQTSMPSSLIAGNLTLRSNTWTLKSSSFSGFDGWSMPPVSWVTVRGDGGGATEVLPWNQIVLVDCSAWDDRSMSRGFVRNTLLSPRRGIPNSALSSEIAVDGQQSTCDVTRTVEVFPPLVVPPVAPSTAVAVVASMGLTALQPHPMCSATSVARLQVSLLSLQYLRRCHQTPGADNKNEDQEEDDVGAAITDNPLQLKLPPPATSSSQVAIATGIAAGAVLGNTILVVCLTLLMTTVPRVASSWRVLHRPEVREQEFFTLPFPRSAVQRSSSTTVAVDAADLIDRISRAISVSLGSLPGNGLSVFLYLLQPTMTEALVAIQRGVTLSNATALVILSVVGFVFFGVISIGFVCVGLWRPFPLTALPAAAAAAARRSSSQHSRLSRFYPLIAAKRVAATLFHEQWRWVGAVGNDAATHFRRRLANTFDAYRAHCQWFCAVDVLLSLVLGILMGVGSEIGGGGGGEEGGGSNSRCSWVLWTTFSLSLLVCVALLLLRPYNTNWDNGFGFATSTITVVVLGLIVVSEDADTANSVAAVQAWLTLLPVVMGALAVLYRWRVYQDDGKTPSTGNERFKSLVDAVEVKRNSVVRPRLPQKRSADRRGVGDQSFDWCRWAKDMSSKEALEALVIMVCDANRMDQKNTSNNNKIPQEHSPSSRTITSKEATRQKGSR